jgi:prevent-host-death family protein
MQIGLREANQKFSRLVKIIKSGRDVLLTERGKPLAVLRPLESGDKTKAAIQRLEAAGFLRPASERACLPAWKPRLLRRRSLLKRIQQGRGKR